MIYTAGYYGRQPEELLALAEERDAIVFDIRIHPASRMPGWSGGRLARFLGERYRHVPELGNRAYKSGGPVEIADLETGLAQVLASPRPVILLCACRDFERCHRRVVAEALKRRGQSVRELDWSERG
jgi:uncharacterized protein (DUF488 family)